MVSPTEDLGNGLVSRTSGGELGFTWQVFDCGTGQYSNISYVQRPDPNSWFLNVIRPPYERYSELNRVKERVYADQRLSLDRIEEFSQAEGLEVDRQELDHEACGCSAFYPNLRGELEPFENAGFYQ